MVIVPSSLRFLVLRQSWTLWEGYCPQCPLAKPVPFSLGFALKTHILIVRCTILALAWVSTSCNLGLCTQGLGLADRGLGIVSFGLE